MKQGRRTTVSIVSIIVASVLTGCGTTAAEEPPAQVSEMVMPERGEAIADGDTIIAGTDNTSPNSRPAFFTEQYSPDVVQDNLGAERDALPELQEEFEAEQEAERKAAEEAEAQRLEEERLERERIAAEEEAERERQAAEQAARKAEKEAERQAEEEAAKEAERQAAAEAQAQAEANTAESSPSESTSTKTTPKSAPTQPADTRSVREMAEDTLAKHGCGHITPEWGSLAGGGRLDVAFSGIDGSVNWGKTQMLLSPNINRIDAEMVAAHECAHYLQVRAYGNWHELNDDMNSLHSWNSTMANGNPWPSETTIGMEINAHCVTELWGYDTTRSPYMDTCSAQELGYAQKIADGQRLR